MNPLKEIKVVARTLSGETIKGWVAPDALDGLSQNLPVYIRFETPGNTLGTYVSQNQLAGFFLVKTFQGQQPPALSRTWFNLKRGIAPHLTMITGATLVAVMSVSGLILFI